MTPKSLAPRSFSQLLLLSRISCGVEYPFGQRGAAVPAVSPPVFLHTPSPLTRVAEWEKEESAMLCKHCSAIGKTLLWYQHWFSYKSKIQHRTGCERIQLTPSQPDLVESLKTKSWIITSILILKLLLLRFYKANKINILRKGFPTENFQNWLE